MTPLGWICIGVSIGIFIGYTLARIQWLNTGEGP